MHDDSTRPPADARHKDDGPPDTTISVKPIFDVFVEYRRVIALAIGVVGLLVAALIMAAALLLPTERSAAISFRLLFDGAAYGLYPNGTTFSPAEIIATPVLGEVYRANDLQRFGLYGDFKDSVTLLHSSFEQELLAASYTARLADTKLTPVDRARLEDEFRKKRDSMKDPVYALTIARRERVKVMPAELIEKVLNDTLAAWAKQADELKGATRFDVPVFSRSALSPEILDKDLLMAADDLRVKARRAADVAAKLMLVPGAGTIRTQKDHVSLSDVGFAIADILRNQIEPMVYLIQERGLATDPQAVAQYIHGHAVELRLERDAARARIQTLQDALQGFVAAKNGRTREGSAGASSGGRPAQGLDTQTLIPQINDSFLDRLIEMSSQTQASEVVYRQRLTDRIIKESEAQAELERSTAYYEGLEKTGRTGSRGASAGQTQAVRAQLHTAFDALVVAVDRLMTVYEELSAQRLNPAATLYAVTEPFRMTTQRAITRSTSVLVITLAMLLTLIAAPIACAVHRLTRRRVPVSHER